MPSELTQELIESVRGLRNEDRELLLLETDPEVSQQVQDAWRTELAHRIESVLDGTAKTLSFDESITRLEQIAAESTSRAV
jgi:hypothetical protein